MLVARSSVPPLASQLTAPSYVKLFSPFLITPIPTCLQAWPPCSLAQKVQLTLSWKEQIGGASLGTASSSILLPSYPPCAVTEEGAFCRDRRSPAINFLVAVAINLLQCVSLSSWALVLLGRWVASPSNTGMPEAARRRTRLVLPSRICPKSQCRNSLEMWC